MSGYDLSHSPALEGCRDRCAKLEAENAELRAALTELVDRVGYRFVEWAGVTTCSCCGADESDFAHSEGCAVQKAEAALEAATEGSERWA